MNCIDNLRALAVISVFLRHCSHSFGLSIPFFGEYGGVFGVQLFFVISGYLIFQSAQNNSLKAYYCHRALRIFPVYIFLYIGLGFALGVIDLSKLGADWSLLLINLASLQHIFPKALVLYDVFHVSWTLTVELFWYLIAPLFVVLIRVYPRITIISSMVLSVLCVSLSELGLLDFVYGDQIADTGFSLEYFRVFFLNNAFPSILVFFVLGAAVSHYRESLLKANSYLLLLSFLVLSIGLSYFNDAQPTSFQLPMIAMGNTELSFLQLSPNFLSGMGLVALLVFSMKCLNRKLGFVKHIADISYSFYLIHFTVILFVANNYSAHPALQSLLSLLIIVLASSVLFYAIEKPFMRIAKTIR